MSVKGIDFGFDFDSWENSDTNSLIIVNLLLRATAENKKHSG